MQPNIFDIATKELHQDAFITWLLQWGAPENKQYDSLLHLCGQEFIRQLISTQYQQPISIITKVEAARQWQYIDIWAEVYTTEANYLIIIEDKIFSGERSDQLISYKKIAEDYCTENNFKIVCVYIKTGSESKMILDSIRAKGFATFNRQNFLDLLDKYKNISNNIFIDFTRRLLNLDAIYNAFETTLINNWNNDCWIGFYQFLEIELGLLRWEYVNPPGGNGFWSACLNWEYWKGFPVYLQIEQGKLCFKIATHPEEIDVDYEFEKSAIRDSWNGIILSNATAAGINEIRRPGKLGNGNYMTVAIVDKHVWLGIGDSVIDKQSVISKLKEYKEFLNSCLGEFSFNIK